MLNRYTAFSLSFLLGAAVNAAPAPVADVNNGSMEQRIEVLERMIDVRKNSQHRIQGQLDTMQNEVNELRGAVELHNHQLEKILQRQRELYLEIDKRMSALTSAPVAVEPDAQELSSAVNEPVISANENEAYDKAVNLILREKQYDQAIPEFQKFIQAFPNSDYVDNAHYWLGQLLFNKQDWKAAAEHFEQVRSNYPESSKRADAIVKLALVEEKRANIARAKQLFQEVIQAYPNSSASSVAEKRLGQL